MINRHGNKQGGISSSKKNAGCSFIVWRGIPYGEVCKLEKTEVENSLKEEIREEIEAKKLKRAANPIGITYSTYNRLMV